VNWIRSSRIGAAIGCLVLTALPVVSLAAEAEAEHHPGIINLNLTLLLQTINFIILVIVLYKFLFKPLASFMEKR